MTCASSSPPLQSMSAPGLNYISGKWNRGRE
jgi:hypothetical protein